MPRGKYAHAHDEIVKAWVHKGRIIHKWRAYLFDLSKPL